MKSLYFQKFEEKINHNLNLNPQILKLYKHFPEKLEDMCHVIFYGPAGSGKYTLALKLINRYSSNSISIP
jgi:replication-associated recombination protein RarA